MLSRNMGLLKFSIKMMTRSEKGSYLLDPVFGIIRNRVNAEVAKTYVRLGQNQKAIQLLRYVLTAQAEDGSWG
jgi:hypothetical protein